MLLLHARNLVRMLSTAAHMTMDRASVAQGIVWQAEHGRRNHAPITARIVTAQLALMTSDTCCGRRISNWAGNPVEDALPLRLAGGLHHLHLSGTESRLAAIYAGQVTDQAQVDATILEVTRDHDDFLQSWLDSPPQTNEAGRSSSIMAALLWLARRMPDCRFKMLEIGASAGANTMMERYAYNLGGTTAGPPDARVQIVPQWRGVPPPPSTVDIAAIRGCDRAVIDLTDDAAALRIKSYCWPENTERLARLDEVIAEARRQPPQLCEADAADWVEARLVEPQEDATCRVLYHSIVWQYISPEGRARIEAAMTAAAERATYRRPLAWIMLETNRETFCHELKCRYWPNGGDTEHLLGQAHAHGAWVEWFGSED